MSEPGDVLDARQAAEYLGLHEETVRRLAREAKIPAYRVGGVWRFSRSFLGRWAESQQTMGGAQHILIVDDEKIIRDTLSRVLQGEGFSVLAAAGGVEALEIMSRDVPGAVLLDLNMPDLNGAGVLKEIRAKYGDLPVVIITGYPDSHLVAEVLEWSPFMLLAKPVDPEKVLRAVRMALGAGSPRPRP